ncbi:MAG: MFS transporter [Gammaproteobacteria bacterium]|nr:MFS transporter [Gammaproteobacteria bacterium]
MPPKGAFAWLVGGAFTHALSFFGEQVVIAYLAFKLTDSSLWVGVALGLYYAPMFFFGLTAGAIADRFNRTKLIAHNQLAAAALLAALAWLVTQSGANGAASLIWVLPLTTAIGITRALYETLRGSIAYDLARSDRATVALGRLNLAGRCGQLVGAFAAGACIDRFGVPSTYALLAGSQCVSFGLLSRLPRLTQPQTSEGVRRGLTLLLEELRGNHRLRVLLALTASVEMFGFSFITLLPELAAQRFDVEAQGLGLLHSARAAGGIATALAFSLLMLRRGSERFYFGVIVTFGCALGLLAFAPTFSVAVGALVLIAGASVSTDILSQSMMQDAVPDRMRGRAMGVWVFAIGAAPLGHIESGLLSNAFGPTIALLINGSVLFAVSIFAWTTLPSPQRR